jgi:hypothetical protein
MNKLRIGVFVAAFTFSAASAPADDSSAQSRGQMDTREAAAPSEGANAAEGAALPKASPAQQLPTRAEKQKAVARSTKERAEGPKEKPLVGDFPPHYGQSLEEYKAEWKRRQDRWEKMTPEEREADYADRKRRDEEWHKMRPQEKEPAKQ